MLRRSSTIAVLILATPLAGCADDGQDVEPRVTYYEDVLPILTEHCSGCHADGGVAPFAVGEFDTDADWAMSIAAATSSRTMPPFNVNNDGSCNTYRDANWLSDEQIATLADWAESGSHEGDPSTPRVEAPKPTVLVSAEILPIKTPPAYQPVPQTYQGGEFEDYQCFLIEPGMATDKFLTGFEVEPGNTATVHHVLGFEVDMALNGATIEALDAASPDQVGWDCFAAAGENVLIEGVPVTWAPGTGATNFPEGTGIRLEAERAIVVQVHYNLVNDRGPDQTTVKLALADSVEREAIQEVYDPFLFTSFSANPASLEPGLESVTYNWTVPLKIAAFLDEPGDYEVYGLLPHMHERGRKMRVEFNAGGTPTCGAAVDRWDFNWQRSFFYDTPIVLNADDDVSVTCDWDTSGDTEPVMPGFGTADEMCLLGLYVVPR